MQQYLPPQQGSAPLAAAALVAAVGLGFFAAPIVSTKGLELHPPALLFARSARDGAKPDRLERYGRRCAAHLENAEAGKVESGSCRFTFEGQCYI